MKVESIEENEDGSANVRFDFNQDEAEELIELGLKLAAYCMASDIQPDEVFSWIEAKIGHTVKVEKIDE